jgi:hypothetical protein
MIRVFYGHILNIPTMKGEEMGHICGWNRPNSLVHASAADDDDDDDDDPQTTARVPYFDVF